MIFLILALLASTLKADDSYLSTLHAGRAAIMHASCYKIEKYDWGLVGTSTATKAWFTHALITRPVQAHEYTEICKAAGQRTIVVVQQENPDLLHYLLDHGYQQTSTNVGKYLEIPQKYEEEITEDSEFRACIVSNEQEFADWCSVQYNTRGFPPKDFMMLYENPAIRFYLGYYKGIPVTASLLVRHDEDKAHACFGATVPSCQRHGFARQLLLFRNNDCRKQGIRLVTGMMTEAGDHFTAACGYKKTGNTYCFLKKL